MPPVEIFPRVFEIKLGAVNTWLIQDEDGLTLIDTGYRDKHQPILDALTALNKQPRDIKRILLTHCHPDHAGGLGALKQASGAPASMHAIDAAVVRGDVPVTLSTPSPGLFAQLLYQLVVKPGHGWTSSVPVEHTLADGDVLSIGGGLRVLHTPGHSAGHVSYLLERDGGLLFAGDVCSNMPALGNSIVHDDHARARATLRALTALDVKAMCFGHGGVLRDTARFKRKWA